MCILCSSTGEAVLTRAFLEAPAELQYFHVLHDFKRVGSKPSETDSIKFKTSPKTSRGKKGQHKKTPS